MATRRSKRDAAEKKMTPVQMEGGRKTSRMVPKRLRYSPPLAGPQHGRKHVVLFTWQKWTPVQGEEGVRKSSRIAPKRLLYSASLPSALQQTRRKRKKHNIENIQHEEKDSSHVDNTDTEVTNVQRLSAYELERLENIRQNQAFLSSINLFQASEDLKKSSAKQPPSQRGLTRSIAVVKEVLPSRKSLRLQNKEAEVFTLPPEPNKTDVRKQPKKPAGPLPLEPVNMAEGSKLPPQFLQLCMEVSSKERRVELDLEEYCSSLKKMTISEDRVVKIVKERIFSAAFHPTSTSFLMAAGDKCGNVGLWSVVGNWGDHGVLLFEPHTRPVCCLAFSRSHPAQLLSLSYDGSLRCMDVEKGAFDDVYNIEDGLKTFDFLSHDCSTLVVGDWYGNLAIVDRRTPGTSHESHHSLDPNVLRCVSVHPLQQQYFAVAKSRQVSIYDLRCLKKSSSQPVSQLPGHSLTVSSCYFSPCTGNRVVTTCMDNYIRIFDTSTMGTEAPLLTSISHFMKTGRWLSKISAVWDPKKEDCLLVGGMSRPRNVHVFHESGRWLHMFKDEERLTTVLSVTAFHPARNAILGGNASGRLHVFSD
ncbi:WD repeat-containing protein 76 isoform X3 [Phycodurus eques]|uniref:WD repeat-containing protein 76 isoform X3 n=1 Tax=Phycodurus eques TaxID=693459 RepID=UPI002ACDB05F|nr:WD repeat-containing protein 76 isoform X3 [Phycodurus eques]